MEYSCPSVCVCCCLSVCLSVHDNAKNNGLIHLKLEHIVRNWALSDQGQGHGGTFKFFSIYHNTKCQVLYLSFGTCQESVFNCVC